MRMKFGNNITMELYGESHSERLGVILCGIPKGILIDYDNVLMLLARRRGGQGAGTTARAEADEPHIVSGLTKCGTGDDTGDGGKSVMYVTTGESIEAYFLNGNIRPQDYEEFKDIPRPGHADYTARIKFGDDYSKTGGGIFSGRMTLPLCFAGAICLECLNSEVYEDSRRDTYIDKEKYVDKYRNNNSKQFEKQREKISVSAELCSVGGYGENSGSSMGPEMETASLSEYLEGIAKSGDSVGAIVKCMASGVPAGLGEPFFDSVESVISHAIFSIPGVKGIEFGSGFAGALDFGSSQNDAFALDECGRVITKTNNSGGINGGITNGMPVLFRVAFKPASSIGLPQKTLNTATGCEDTLNVKGRHDACIAVRALPVVEAMTAFCLFDLFLEYTDKK